MAINVGNAPVKKIFVGSTPVREVYVGSTKIWPTGPRVVTVQTTSLSWIVGSETGDTSMIQALTGPYRLVFSAPVTCNQAVKVEGQATQSAGRRLEPGWVLSPNTVNRTHTFTEIME